MIDNESIIDEQIEDKIHESEFKDLDNSEEFISEENHDNFINENSEQEQTETNFLTHEISSKEILDSVSKNRFHQPNILKWLDH